MLPTDRIAYSAITERAPLKLPDGARMAVWVIVNVEEWNPREPMPRTVLTPPAGGSPMPDIPNWAWHEYGNRVGFWRFVDDQALITDTMADLDDVLRMFSSLTRISQIETTTRTSGFRSVDLVEVTEAVVDLYDAAAEDKAVKLTVVGDKPVVITGDRDLLFDAVANLVDNAIKHGREAGKVTVQLSQADADAVISVADNGPGIPIDERQHVFRRFYRRERSRCTPGNGLGLSLVAAVARLHDARIKLFDNAPGLKIELRLPSS